VSSSLTAHQHCGGCGRHWIAPHFHLSINVFPIVWQSSLRLTLPTIPRPYDLCALTPSVKALINRPILHTNVEANVLITAVDKKVKTTLMVSSLNLLYMHLRLCEIMGKDQLFGGLSAVFSADLLQLPQSKGNQRIAGCKHHICEVQPP